MVRKVKVVNLFTGRQLPALPIKTDVQPSAPSVRQMSLHIDREYATLVEIQGQNNRGFLPGAELALEGAEGGRECRQGQQQVGVQKFAQGFFASSRFVFWQGTGGRSSPGQKDEAMASKSDKVSKKKTGGQGIRLFRGLSEDDNDKVDAVEGNQQVDTDSKSSEKDKTVRNVSKSRKRFSWLEDKIERISESERRSSPS